MSVTIDTGIDTTETTVAPIHTAEASLAEMKALVATLEAQAGSVTREIGRPVVEHLLTTETCKTSEKSGWTGFAKSVDIRVDGKKYLVKFVVTDVEATDAHKNVDKETAKAAAVAKEKAALKAKLAALDAA